MDIIQSAGLYFAFAGNVSRESAFGHIDVTQYSRTEPDPAILSDIELGTSEWPPHSGGSHRQGLRAWVAEAGSLCRAEIRVTSSAHTDVTLLAVPNSMAGLDPAI
jgi:hypothetical protein